MHIRNSCCFLCHIASLGWFRWLRACVPARSHAVALTQGMYHKHVLKFTFEQTSDKCKVTGPHKQPSSKSFLKTLSFQQTNRLLLQTMTASLQIPNLSCDFIHTDFFWMPWDHGLARATIIHSSHAASLQNAKKCCLSQNKNVQAIKPVLPAAKAKYCLLKI